MDKLNRLHPRYDIDAKMLEFSEDDDDGKGL